jgi:hypothetical protein
VRRQKSHYSNDFVTAQVSQAGFSEADEVMDAKKWLADVSIGEA